jgi:hypothetical protein
VRELYITAMGCEIEFGGKWGRVEGFAPSVASAE